MADSLTFSVTPANTPEPVHIDTPSPNAPHPLTTFHEYTAINGTSILQSTPTNPTNFLPSSNGFLDAVIRAYNHHHNLVLRPDDIWIAIMLQFSRFVNANAETLRTQFVSHEGQKELQVSTPGTLLSVDYGHLSNEMAKLLRQHITDAQVCDWVTPDFSTTTDNDRIVGSVVLMTAMQKYFTYKYSICCGIPNVTILGTVDDWTTIRTRVAKLAEYGPECTKWSAMLSGIVDEFVTVVAEGKPVPSNLDYWQRICHYTNTGSGSSYISGWISAFAVFTEKGEWQGDELSVSTWTGMTIDGFKYPVVKTADIPAGYATVDVSVNDNGVEYKCAMFVGHTGYDVVDTCGIAPKLTWAMVVKGDKKE
ncbi:hypothetical protein HDU98_008613 [Podochytrium sp. JEL0797]|nr:hypothetical protein HDU98_008613 [Podochytrium sp. JEL0797]